MAGSTALQSLKHSITTGRSGSYPAGEQVARLYRESAWYSSSGWVGGALKKASAPDRSIA
jgi:hypothetical protein